MKLETILQILYANKMEDVIALAVMLDNNIETVEKYPIGEVIPVEIGNSEIEPLGIRFEDRSYGNYPCEVIGINKYALDKRYLVKKPNGKSVWVSDHSFGRETAKTISIQQAQQKQQQLV